MAIRRLITKTEIKNREIIKEYKDPIAAVIKKIAAVCGLSEEQEKALSFYLTKK